MRFGAFFVLLCFSLCNGAPPRGGKPTFNEEERKLIFEELLKPSSKRLTGASTWEAILAEHNRRRLVDKHPAFQHERTAGSLRWHLFELRHRGLLPDEIMKKFRIQPKANSRTKTDNIKHPYNEEEKKVIYQELLKPSCRKLYGKSTLEAICAEHDRRRLIEKLPEFQHERTMYSIRSQIMRLRDQFPLEIEKKFGKQRKGVSSSIPPNQESDEQVTIEGQDENELAVDEMIEEVQNNTDVDEMIEELLHNTDYEIDFSRLDP